jgi:hypothetical protein
VAACYWLSHLGSPVWDLSLVHGGQAAAGAPFDHVRRASGEGSSGWLISRQVLRLITSGDQDVLE